jgi:hypothetical protein
MRRTVGTVIAAAVLVVIAGCESAGDPDVTPAPGAPRDGGAQDGGPTRSPLNVNVAAALRTAEREFAALTAGDWAVAWRLWTDSAKRQVPMNVFVAANKACPVALRKAYTLQEVRPINNELIELTFRRGDTVEHGALRTVQGGWGFEPDTASLVEYTNGVEATVDKRKAAGQCT